MPRNVSGLTCFQAGVCTHLFPGRYLFSPIQNTWAHLFKDSCLRSPIQRQVSALTLQRQVLTFSKTGVYPHLFKYSCCAHLFRQMSALLFQDRRLSTPNHRQVSPVTYLKEGVYLPIRRQASTYLYKGSCLRSPMTVHLLSGECWCSLITGRC